MTDTDKTSIQEGETTLYEVGYHIIPTVSEDKVSAEVDKIRAAIEGEGGAIVTDTAPQSRDLAYPLSKVFSNNKSTFDTAYFGFITFTMSPSHTPSFKTKLDQIETILRYLIIKTDEESVAESSQKESTASSADKKEGSDRLSESELDKTIEELVTE